MSKDEHGLQLQAMDIKFLEELEGIVLMVFYKAI